MDKDRNRETRAEATATIQVGDSGGWTGGGDEEWSDSRYTVNLEPQVRCRGVRGRGK